MIEHLHSLSHLGSLLFFALFLALPALILSKRYYPARVLSRWLLIATAVGGLSILGDGWLSSILVSREVQCRSNMKEIQLAILMYAQDWNDTYPPAHLWADIAIAHFPKDKSAEEFRCPAAPSPFG